MKDSMVVTIDMNNGEQAYFKIEFLKSDFFAVVDGIDGLTLDNVETNPLWKVI